MWADYLQKTWTCTQDASNDSALFFLPLPQGDWNESEAKAVFLCLFVPVLKLIWNIKAKLRPSIFHTSFCKQQMNKLYHERGHNLCISISPWPISQLFWMASRGVCECAFRVNIFVCFFSVCVCVFLSLPLCLDVHMCSRCQQWLGV